MYPYAYLTAFDPAVAVTGLFTWDLDTATPVTPPVSVDSVAVGLLGWGNVLKDMDRAGNLLYIARGNAFCVYEVGAGPAVFLGLLDPVDGAVSGWIGVDDFSVCFGGATWANRYPPQCGTVTTVSAPLIAGSGRRLLSALPNPTRGAADIVFTPTRAGILRLDVFDVAGRRIAELANGRFEGRSVVRWDGTGRDGTPVPAGVYFVRLKGRDDSATEKLVLVR
jgi:hypothetical protein